MPKDILFRTSKKQENKVYYYVFVFLLPNKPGWCIDSSTPSPHAPRWNKALISYLHNIVIMNIPLLEKLFIIWRQFSHELDDFWTNGVPFVRSCTFQGVQKNQILQEYIYK